ncbi:hypothetical protein [Paenibacillus sabinae]|uniref:Uncharacterized protein n=1 Tax=Paenibacillus sabinae T27 TaxID=1268072 RepID=X4ZHJ0_9BACL|nr:hypothetical protein [Paenibacillus sabinae]AHV98981.1 hypothetical protein PSAB_20450 [Paenibacillus sabinae T27]
MDILDVIDAADRFNAQRQLADLNNAVMAQTTNVEDFRKYTGALQQRAGYGEVPDKPAFDKTGFERMKMKMKLGI